MCISTRSPIFRTSSPRHRPAICWRSSPGARARARGRGAAAHPALPHAAHARPPHAGARRAGGTGRRERGDDVGHERGQGLGERARRVGDHGLPHVQRGSAHGVPHVAARHVHARQDLRPARRRSAPRPGPAGRHPGLACERRASLRRCQPRASEMAAPCASVDAPSSSLSPSMCTLPDVPATCVRAGRAVHARMCLAASPCEFRVPRLACLQERGGSPTLNSRSPRSSTDDCLRATAAWSVRRPGGPCRRWVQCRGPT